MHLAEECNEVLQRAAEPIDRPCREDIELAPRDAAEEAIEPGSLIATLDAADTAVDEFGDDAPPMVGGSLLKCKALVVD
jgi:hypothetical protein